MITIWQEITIQGMYCDLDMGTNTGMYYKCSHVPNLLIFVRVSVYEIRFSYLEDGKCLKQNIAKMVLY